MLGIFNVIVNSMGFKFLFSKIGLLVYKNIIGDFAKFPS